MRTLTPSRALLRAALLACSLALAAASHQFVRLTVDNAQVNLDGVTRIAYTINGQTPGPAIHAVVGDELTIEVVNMLHTEAISLHWHGLIMRDNPWNDGTAFITQYPIPPMTSLNYTVKPTEPGTHWYHSHTGTQFGDGMYGPFIVHETAPKAEDPPEHIVMISEWYHRTSADIIADMRANVYEAHNPPWISGHINGNGRYDCKSACFDSHVHFQHSLACIPGHNYSVFSMDSTQPTHRLRIISTTTGTTLRFSIDDHPLTVIAIDGRPVKPVQAHVLRVFVGQRYDVLYTPKAAGGLSWMRVRSLNHTAAAPQEVLAIVRDLAQPPAGSDQTEPSSSAWEIGAQGVVEVYDHAGGMVPEDGQPAPPSIEDAKMVVLHTSCMDMMPGMGGGSGSMGGGGGGGSMGGMPGMPGMGPMPATNGSTPRSHQGHRCTVNDISFHSPSKPVGLCLIDNSPLPTGIVHNVSLSHGDKALVALNNEGMQGHPWHLHGHGFWILGAGMEGEGNFDMEKHKDRLNLKNPLIRDTAHVEAGSWLLLLFEADNPGFWPFHCHVEWHLDAGLAMLFLEAVDRIPPPPPSMPVTTTFADRSKPADAMAQMTQAQFFGVGMLTGVFIGVAVAFGAQRCFAPGDRKSSGKYTRVSSAEDHANHNGDTALQDVQVAGGGVNKQFSIGDDEPHSTQETELQPL